MFQDPTPSSRRDSSEDEVSNPQTEMARHRAASADAWRGYVEAGAIMHRQQALLLDARNRDLESEIFYPGSAKLAR